MNWKHDLEEPYECLYHVNVDIYHECLYMVQVEHPPCRVPLARTLKTVDLDVLEA